MSKKDVFDNFGFNLGFGAKKWIKVYGDQWQFHLAKAIASGWKRSRYDDPKLGPKQSYINVPRASAEFRADAFRYLKRYEAELKFSQSKGVRTNKAASYGQYLFNLKILHGNARAHDFVARGIIYDYRKELFRATTLADKRRIKRELDKFMKHSHRKAWEVKAEEEMWKRKYYAPRNKYYMPKKHAFDILGELTEGYKGRDFDYYDRARHELFTLGKAEYTMKNEYLSELAMDELEAIEEGRWPDQAVKRSNMDTSEPFDVNDPSRIVEYLEKTKAPWRKDLIDGIRRSKAAYNLVKARLGRQWMEKYLYSKDSYRYVTTSYKPRNLREVRTLTKPIKSKI